LGPPAHAEGVRSAEALGAKPRTQAAGRRPADRFDGCLAGEPAWRGWPHHIDRTDRRRSPAEAPGDGGFAGLGAAGAATATGAPAAADRQ
jgi:hypothetical protein